MDVNDFLEHHGIKGQKWGIRNKRRSNNVKESKSSKPNAKELSDEELRKAVNRMQMENQYKTLINNSKKKRGSEFVKSVGLNVAKTTATALVTQQVAVALKKAKISK